MNFQTSPMFSQPTIAYNPQALNYLRVLMLSQNPAYQNKMNFFRQIPQKSTLINSIPIQRIMSSPSIFDLRSTTTSYDIALKTNASPVSNSMYSLSDERRDISESEESLEVPTLSETESLIKEESPENLKNEEHAGLMRQSKKIQKPSPSTSLKPKNMETKQNNNNINVKRQRWHDDEDVQLLALFAKHGPKWTVIASLMTGRTAKQVRDRYTNILRPDIKRDQWSEEEEKLFMTLYAKYGNRWCKIAEHLPGRSENQVKNKFYCHKKRDEFIKFQVNGENEDGNATGGSGMKMEYENFPKSSNGENISLKIKEEA